MSSTAETGASARHRAGGTLHGTRRQRTNAVGRLIADRFTGVENAAVPRGAAAPIPVLLH